MQTETDNIKRFDFFGLRDYEAPYVEPVIEESAEEVAALDTVEAPAPPPEVTFSESDMESSKASAKQEGYQQGLLEADAATQKEIQAQNEQSINLLKQIQQQLSMLHIEYERQTEALTHDSNALALLVAKLMAGKALQDDIAAPAEALLRECFPHLMQMPDLTLNLHPDTAEAMYARINTIAAEYHFEGSITIETKASLAANDATLSWSGGSAEQRLTKAWQEIKTRILPESYYGHLEQKTNALPAEEATPKEEIKEAVELLEEEKVAATASEPLETPETNNQNTTNEDKE